jgi:thymidylate kinase
MSPSAKKKRADSTVRPGRLVIFEGPDESGKTTVSKLVAEELRRTGQKCIWLAFPGAEPDTLGAEIHALHHDIRFAKAPPLSVQLLHVAAHIEALERRIVPELTEGTWVILDRFWWSTWVYGLAAGADRTDLRLALEIERRQWGRIQPTLAFLFVRDLPNRRIQPSKRVVLQKLYLQLVKTQRREHPVEIVHNNSGIDDALRDVMTNLLPYSRGSR